MYRIDKHSDIGWESFLKLGKDETSQAKVEELKNLLSQKIWQQLFIHLVQLVLQKGLCCLIKILLKILKQLQID